VADRLGVAAGERVVVLHNPPQAAIARLIAAACEARQAAVEVVEFATLSRHGEAPPADVEAAIARADACVGATERSLSHTAARRSATEAGTRFASMPGITEAIFHRAVPADYDAMTRDGAAIAALLTEADEVRITSAQGTDLTLSVRGRSGLNDDGDLRAAGAFGNLPAGEGYIAPVEDAGEGVLVVDGSLAGHGRLTDPLEIQLSGGRLVRASGEVGARLESALDAGGPLGRHVAEFAVGTNPAATVVGNILEDEKVRGTCHVAFGSSAGIGGVNQAGVHLDAVLLEPTVHIGGTLVVEAGRLVL
jgi:leucyl aminopeptidase (aminopeptidase T)